MTERRVNRRLQCTGDRACTVRFRVGGKGLEAPVLNISKFGMQIAPPTDENLPPDTQVCDAIITSVRGNKRSVGPLRYLESVTLASDRRVWRLVAQDSTTQADLWHALNMLRTKGIEELPRRRILSQAEVPRVPGRGLYTEQSRLERLDFARKASGCRLDSLQQTTLDATRLTSNIEGLIGGVEIPVGLAGPLVFRGQSAQGIIYAPYATTEGALVASATRGATALTRAGGVTTRVVRQRMMRVPMFELSDMEGAFGFASWIEDHFGEIAEQVRKVSRHAKLISVEPHLLGSRVHVQFLYETGDAAGQNMTTATTWHACLWLMRQMDQYPSIRFENFLVEANMSGDKKVNYQSFIQGRGIRVAAEAFIPGDILWEVLKVKPEQLVRAHHDFLGGTISVGMVGSNVNFSNTVAAIFAATGQDIACVHESSIGVFDLQPHEQGVHVSVMLPSLILGTVGGGTHLARQHELLELMGCAGPSKVSRLAEIIAGYCMALDLSTLSAITSGQFATAHERLGRNRPVQWFERKDLDAAFFQWALSQAAPGVEVKLLDFEEIQNAPMGSSIITELTARKVQKHLGLFIYRLRYEQEGAQRQRDVVVKLKPTAGEVMLMLNTTASMCGGKLAEEYARFSHRTGFDMCHLKELAMYRHDNPELRDHMPEVLATLRDEAREAHILVLERLSREELLLVDTADDVSDWTTESIDAVIRGAAAFHSVYYDRTHELAKTDWLGTPLDHSAMVEMTPLWSAMAIHASSEFPEWFSVDDLALLLSLVRSLPIWWWELSAMPKTLIHNDFNPRNLCLRRTDQQLRLVAYDWELSTIHLPQHDLAELLCFVFEKPPTLEQINHHLELHRAELEARVGTPIDPAQWRLGYRYCLYDFAVNRTQMYIMSHTLRHYPFMERVFRTLKHLISLERERDIDPLPEVDEFAETTRVNGD
ncbi:MAG: phosphotransferase [Myxococcota bacterium]|jgi:NADP-dependent 3-hydroxy-3-methylglutaryl-CoA reductase|nr:phosphotransferase [Myxococcota bacterium]